MQPRDHDTNQESPSFLAMIDAEAKADPERQAQAGQRLVQNRASRDRRDPAITAALRARFGVTTQVGAT